MICPHCRFENDMDADFCEHCGKPLEKLCPECGSPVNPGAMFCKKCGTQLNQKAEDSLPSDPANTTDTALPAFTPSQENYRTIQPVEGERKPVTILFTDIVGSTSIAEKLDPEEWKEIVNGVHRLVTQVIYRYEGTLAQLLGDGSLAFFGAPLTHEDDSLRAIHAALDIQEAAGGYQHQLTGLVENFQLRVGIHAGTVVVGKVGDDRHTEYLAVGDAVNLAARLQSAARPGGVLVSETIARQVKAAFELQALGEISVKGKSEPVSVFEVLNEKLIPDNPRGFEELRSPLIGRHHELSLMQDVLDGLASGRGQVVMILGEAGIGKSRLVDEACRMADANQPQLHWIEGRALSYGQSLPFWTVKQLLYSDLGLSDGDPEIRIKTALKKRGKELFGEQTAEVLPYLFHLTGVAAEEQQAEHLKDLDGETLKHQTLVTVRRYFERLAQTKPAAIVFEDLHWTDPSSLVAIEQLMSLTDRVPIALILVARPDRELPSWRLKLKAETDYAHRYTEIALKPLSAEEQNRLVDNLLALADLPASLLQLILDQADGNPFYLEEIIRELIDQGIICFAAGCWRASGDMEKIRIPATLEGVLLARIDRLPVDIRHTLQLAAVIGKSFLYRLLAMIVAKEQDLDGHLAQLQRADLVREKSRKPELEYIFKHSLTQEAAYNSLLLERRKEFHRRVGEALEQLFTDRQEQFVGLFAYHFEAAGEQAKAVDYLIRAGDQARLTDEHSEAIDYYQRAIKLLQAMHDDQRTARVWLKLGLIYHANFEFEASHQAYETAFRLQQAKQVDETTKAEDTDLVFKQALFIPFNTLDPGIVMWQDEARIVASVYSGLARINHELDVLPEVARSWQVLENGTRYLFHLRDDFQWSDGSPLTALDFEWAWKRNLNPMTKSDNAAFLYDISGAREFHLGIDPNPDHVGIRALDPQTFEVRLNQAVAYFPFILTLPVTLPLPKTAIERYGGDWWQPGKILTNGPFLLEKIEPQQFCSAVRNPHYPGRREGNIHRIEWQVIGEPAARAQAYRDDRVDMAEMIVREIPPDIPRHDIYNTTTLQVLYLYFNLSVRPLNDPRVRKALIMAFDGNQYYESQHTKVARGGLIPPGMPGHSPDIGLQPNIGLAQQSLAEAGYPGGKGFPELEGFALEAIAAKFGEELPRQWHENLGIKIHFHGSEPWGIKDWVDKRVQGALVINGWIADYPDPDTFLRQSEINSMLDYFGWQDADFTRLVEQAASTADRGKRMEMYRQADYLLVHDQALVMPLNYGLGPVRQLIKPWVKNCQPNQLEWLDYQDIIIERE